MIVVYAGRLPGPEFPREHEQDVHDQLKLMLAGLRPRLVVGSAAAGGDLLALATSTELTRFDIKRHIVLPGETEEFRRKSVVVRGDPYGVWSRRFDDVRAAPGTHVAAMSVPTDDRGFRAASNEIVRFAMAERKIDEPVVGIRIGPPLKRSGPGPDLTAHVADTLQNLGCLVLNIDTTRSTRPEAFVAMPFGTKDLRPAFTWSRYDSDLSFERVFVPALISAGFVPRRMDNDNVAGVIDSVMLRHLGEADFVVADLTGLNPNVFWELGIRHAWKPRGTTLVALQGVNVPFDVERVPVRWYTRGEDEVSETDLVTSIKSVLPAFEHQAGSTDDDGDIDSPVFQHVHDLPEMELPPPSSQQYVDTVNGLDRAVGRASQLRQGDELIRLADRVGGTKNLSKAVRNRLHERIGHELVSLDYLDEARQVLAPLAEADSDYANVTLQCAYAHTLIRGKHAPDQQLTNAQLRLRLLLREHGPYAEASGLLGSAAKELAVRAHQQHRGSRAWVRHAVDAAQAYESGYRNDANAYYPGVNAVAMYRMLGQHWDTNNREKHLRAAREMLAPVRFVVDAAMRAREPSGWVLATDAELRLHEYLLGAANLAADAPAPQHLVDTFDELCRRTNGNKKVQGSLTRQLTMLRHTGDPPQLLTDLINRLDD